MGIFLKRSDFTLITHEGISRYYEPAKRKVSLSELATYAEKEQIKSGQNPLPWVPDLYNDKSTLYSTDNKHAVRHWISLTDTHGHSFNDDWAFLTIEYFSRDDMGILVRTGLKHYMPLDWAAREVEDASKQSVAELQAMIQTQIEYGIKSGVARAIEESVTNLKEVQVEKRRIDEQIAILQAERERMEIIEQRLKDREDQRLAHEAERLARRQNKPRSGYVYLIQSLTALSYYKIGRTIHPEHRMKRFEVKLPFEIQPICFIPTDDMYALERKLHRRYAGCRTEGEFFALSVNDIAYIKALADDPTAVKELLNIED